MYTERRNEQGFVAIIVVSMLLVLLSLITIGFNRQMQREYRQALDQQLTTQAFYAAETGVNDFINELKAGNITEGSKTDCDVNSDPKWNNGEISDDVSYTCLQYNFTSETIVNRDVSADDFKNIDVALVGSNTEVLDSLTFTWSGTDSQTNAWDCNSDYLNRTSIVTGEIPMARVDILPRPGTSAVYQSRDAIQNATAHFYLYPCSNGVVTADYQAALNGAPVEVGCDNNGSCEVEITNLLGVQDYIVRARGVYAPINFDISGEKVNGAVTETASFSGQISVDVTGRAADVVRRIRVDVTPYEGGATVPTAGDQGSGSGVSSAGTSDYPSYGVHVFEGICKELSVSGNNALQQQSCN